MARGQRAGKHDAPGQGERKAAWGRRFAPAVWLLLAALWLQVSSSAPSARAPRSRTTPAGASLVQLRGNAAVAAAVEAGVQGSEGEAARNASATNSSECELKWVCPSEEPPAEETPPCPPLQVPPASNDTESDGGPGAEMSDDQVKDELQASQPEVSLLEEGGHSKGPEMAILFLLVTLVIGCFVRLSLEKVNARWGVGIPSTVMLLVVGVVIGLITWDIIITDDGEPNEPFTVSIMMWTWMDPRLILFMFLPALIFEGAMNTDYFIFKHQFAGGIMLAGPGMLFQIVLIAVWAVNFFPYGWGMTESLLFGSILSATDPVAVIALMKEMAVLSDLRVLFVAESLMNDGTAIVVFELCLMVLLDPTSVANYFRLGCQVIHVSMCAPCLPCTSCARLENFSRTRMPG